MANKKAPTLEDNAKATLSIEEFQNILGSNKVKKDPFQYGQLGVQSSDSAMNSEGIQKLRQEEYNALVQEYNQLGVAGEPNYPSNQEVSHKVMKQIQESKERITLGGLEGIVKSLGFDAKLSDGMKKYTFMELINKTINYETGEQDLEKLSKDEQYAFEKYQILSQAYDRGCVYKTTEENKFADLNAKMEELDENYNPKNGGEQ